MGRYRAVEEAVKAAESKMGTFREVLAMRREREMAAPMTSPIAQLIAELRDYAESIACGMTLDCPVDRALVQAAILSAAEALARQEELLAEAGKVLAEAAGDIEGWGAYADDYFKDKHDLAGDVERYRRAAARLSDKLKGE